MQEGVETKRALIVVRTYPNPEERGVESSCTAAITERQEWLRLFPVPYRFLDYDKRFRKYQWVDVGVRKSKDARPESYEIVRDSIKILGDPLPTENSWEERKKIIFPLRAHCLCCLQQSQQKSGRPTLGFFRPGEIFKLKIKKGSNTWLAAQLDILRQGHFFNKPPATELEKVPYKFFYSFRCNHDDCTGHNLSCVDWEMGQSWRKWSTKYGESWEEKFVQRYEEEMIDKKDTHFFVGTVKKHPTRWIIVGLFYPPHVAQGTLAFS